MHSLCFRIFALLSLVLAGTSLCSSLDTNALINMVKAREQIAQPNLYANYKNALDNMVKASKDARDHIINADVDTASDIKTLEKMITNEASSMMAQEDNFARITKDKYLFEMDLHPGRKIHVLHLQKTPISYITFLPSQSAEKIPFSSAKFPEIFEYFSVKDDSVEANIMKETIEVCERPTIGGADKFCATSLESLVSMVVSKLGKGVQVLSSEVDKETQSQEFTILKGVKPMGEKEVVCHKLKYPYAVFYCHSIEKTTVFQVPMVASDGTRARAIAVCHKDTSSWSPNHLAFQLLQVKPGTVPICHFVPSETLIWLPKN